MNKIEQNEDTILVLGGTGKTGRRVVERLKTLGVPTRVGSRSGQPPFDWGDTRNWDQVLSGATAVYISFSPDLAVPGATYTISSLIDRAVISGVKRAVLLSGRGEEEAQRCERLIQRDDIEWTILRAAWFAQNFSEGAFMDMVRAGEVVLPAGDVTEPFIDAEDIADVAVAALTEDGHTGQVYEVTGPRLLTFAQAINEIATTTGRDIRYRQIPIDAFIDGAKAADMPGDLVWLLEYLFTNVLDGRNEYLSDGVQRALGREPCDFTDYVRKIATTDTWNVAE